ncbi:hypothetical protein RIF29_26426 [Crotalaria pallida]|uniref:diacylglycerol O-acyltransferase n=1 Tax=Crotalaria pallida TaxID=3830 RepID=A0AAN9HZV2_CROPI
MNEARPKGGEGEKEGEAKMASLGGEPLSPAAQMFHAPSLNLYVIAVIGCKTSIDPQVFKAGLCQTLLKHPRFTSNLVKNGRKTRWTPTTVNIDNHVIVPELDPKIEIPDRFIEDYISDITKTPLDMSKPLWELHLLNIKTSDAEAVAIFRIHHSLGDGASLMSLLLASTRKTSYPNALPTVPTKKRVGSNYYHESSLVPKHTIISRLWWILLAIWWGMVLIWHTMVDIVIFVLTTFCIKDTWTPLKGAPGVEHSTKRFVHRTLSMNDIKFVKEQMKTVISTRLLWKIFL